MRAPPLRAGTRGTAVGTGLNAPEGFAAAVIGRLAGAVGLPLREAQDHFEAQAAREALVAASAALRGLGLAVGRVADDLRWLSSGPRTGLGELRLPALQPGSSIMPGKVNPVVCESVMQVAAHVVGCDAAVMHAAATLGDLDLHVGVPVMVHEVLTAAGLLANAATLLADRAVAGMTADEPRMRRMAEASAAVITAVAPAIGYEAAAAVVRRSEEHGTTVVEELAGHLGITVEAAARLVDVDGMTGV